jgi:uncharacterized protein YcbK (DUF882 family)
MSVLGGMALDTVRRLLPAPRDAFRAALAHLPVVLASVVVALTVTHPTAADPPTERGFRLASRKGPRVAAPASEEDAAENSEVETLATLYNIHTGEAMPLSSSEPQQSRFSEALADRITASRIDLDPRLLDLLREVARRNPGGRIELVSGYRSTKLNEMLRKKGHNVASKSQHSLGHAVDFRIVGMTPAEMKQEVQKLGWEGGIGRYDKITDWFVHADVGPKREWYEGR